MSTTPQVVGISFQGSKAECHTQGFLRTRPDGSKYFWATGQAHSGRYTGDLPTVSLESDELIAADLRE